MREADRLPDWLVEGLVEEEDEQTTKQASPKSLWQRVDTGNTHMLVRSAKKKSGMPIRRLIYTTKMQNLKEP